MSTEKERPNTELSKKVLLNTERIDALESLTSRIADEIGLDIPAPADDTGPIVPRDNLSPENSVRVRSMVAFPSANDKPIDSISQWFKEQAKAPWVRATSHPTDFLVNAAASPSNTVASYTVGWQALTWLCKFRTRAATFLQTVAVVSERHGVLGSGGRHNDLLFYWDWCMENALGNYKDFMLGVIHSPMMGAFLSYLGSKKKVSGRTGSPDENMARELLQLFALGLLIIDENGKVTGRHAYNGSTDVTQLARLFTGWTAPAINSKTGLPWPRYDATFNGHLRREIWNRQNHGRPGLFDNTRRDNDTSAENPQFVGESVGLQTEPKFHDFELIELSFGTIPSDQAEIDALGDLEIEENWIKAEAIMHKRMRIALDLIFGAKDPVDGRLIAAKRLAHLLISNHVSMDFSGEYFRRVYDAIAVGYYTLPDGSVVGEGKPYDLFAGFCAVSCDVEALEVEDADRPATWGRRKRDFEKLIGAIAPLLDGIEGDTPEIFNHGLVTTQLFRVLGNGFGAEIVDGRPFAQESVFGWGDRTPRDATEWVRAVNRLTSYLDDSAGPGRAIIRSGEDQITLNYERWSRLWDDPAALLDAIALEYIGRPLDDDLRSLAIKELSKITVSVKGHRVKEALFFVLTSPQYSTQR